MNLPTTSDVFWSYNLPAHIKSAHPEENIGTDFAASFAITDDKLVNLKLKTGMTGKGRGAKKGEKRKVADAAEEPTAQRRRTE